MCLEDGRSHGWYFCVRLLLRTVFSPSRLEMISSYQNRTIGKEGFYPQLTSQLRSSSPGPLDTTLTKTPDQTRVTLSQGTSKSLTRVLTFPPISSNTLYLDDKDEIIVITQRVDSCHGSGDGVGYGSSTDLYISQKPPLLLTPRDDRNLLIPGPYYL